MEELTTLFENLRNNSNSRFDNFSIEEIKTLSKIQEDAYLENPKWLGGDEEFVCLSIDLDKSSRHSAQRNVQTMAKLYDYFTQNIVDILNTEDFRADYIDIKGDGAFGIYEGENSEKKALVAAITFKTFFEKHIQPKFKTVFDLDLHCKLAIDKNKLLVKKIGTRKHKNEVWAGKLINNVHKIMSLAEEIGHVDGDPLIVSEKIYEYYKNCGNEKLTISCGCDLSGNPSVHSNLWIEHTCESNPDITDNKIYYNSSRWCKKHGDEYLQSILND
ncbi:hypothetical protein ACFL3T_04905 [Patescibacteria group bacterium]